MAGIAGSNHTRLSHDAPGDGREPWIQRRVNPVDPNHLLVCLSAPNAEAYRRGVRRLTESAEALTESTICFIGRDDIQQLIDGNNALGTHLIRRLATESNKAEDARFRMMRQQVRARFAYLLLHLIEREAEVDDQGRSMVVLSLSRGDLAGIVGSRPETITRSIRALELDGVATFDGRRVTVPDVSRLRRESEVQSD